MIYSDHQSCMDDEEAWLDKYGRGCEGCFKKFKISIANVYQVSHSSSRKVQN